MKVSIATALSVAGVLAAGAAAYAVNVSVLDAPSSSPSSLVSTTAPAGSPVSPSDANSAGGAVTADAVRVNDTTTSYNVGKAGTVVISTASGAVVVTSVVPNAGYTSEPARTEANGLVKVHFNSATSRIEFTAQMVNGEVVVKVNNESAPAGVSGGNLTKPTFPGGNDDDNDHEERHHDGDHEFEGDDD